VVFAAAPANDSGVPAVYPASPESFTPFRFESTYTTPDTASVPFVGGWVAAVVDVVVVLARVAVVVLVLGVVDVVAVADVVVGIVVVVVGVVLVVVVVVVVWPPGVMLSTATP
jgi:hypothetical protein